MRGYNGGCKDTVQRINNIILRKIADHDRVGKLYTSALIVQELENIMNEIKEKHEKLGPRTS